MENINVGEQISYYRKEKGLNSKELAGLAQMTPSMLSQIERGLANPSIQSLRVIAKALDVPMFSFFVERNNTKELIVRGNQRKKIIAPENEDLSYELLSPNLNGALELALMTLQPGSFSSKEPMDHVGEEVAYILEGQVVLQLDEDLFTLNKGDSVKIPPHMKHKWDNVSKENTVVIFAVTPPSF